MNTSNVRAESLDISLRTALGTFCLSQQNRGGGAAGLLDRKGGAAGHSKFLCTICGVQAPSLASMKVQSQISLPLFTSIGFPDMVNDGSGAFISKGALVEYLSILCPIVGFFPL